MKHEAFYLFESGRQMGPWTFAEVVRQMQSGQLGAIVFVMSEKKSSASLAPTWTFIFDLPEFRAALLPAAPAHDPQTFENKNVKAPVVNAPPVVSAPANHRDTKSISANLLLPGVAIVHNNVGAWTGKVFDLSIAGGTLSLKGHHLGIGDKLFVHYALPDDETKMISLKVIVTGVGQSSKGTKYETEKLVAFELGEVGADVPGKIKQILATANKGAMAA